MRGSLLLAALFSAPVFGEPLHVDGIQWMLSDGNDIDGLQGFIAARMPGRHHPVTFANFSRIWDSIQRGEPVCSTQVLRNQQREPLMYFSPTGLAPPAQVVMRKSSVSRMPLGPGGGVDLVRLLADGQLRGVSVASRSYGNAVDAQVVERPAAGGLTPLYSRGAAPMLLRIVQSEHADYALAYEADLLLIKRGDGALRRALEQELVFMPIEGAQELAQVGIACARTPWGRAAIQGVDAALSNPASVAQLRQVNRRWLPSAALTRYAREYEAFYRLRAQPMLRP